jgi:nucleotide sugar dehydrogenase
MKQKVSVIGVGRLGLSFALLLDSKGYDVVGCDVNEKYIEALGNKTFSSKEPAINDFLIHSKIKFTTCAKDALNHAEIIFVFVPTPSNPGGDYNHKYVDQVISKIESNNIRYKTLVIGCTVMPYYCDSIQTKLFPFQIDVVYNPEFIAQGQIVSGLENADIVLMGATHKIPDLLFAVYKDIMGKTPNFKVTSLTGAEIAKISINCFLTLKIAFANMVGEIITNSYEEENMDAILDAIGGDSRIGNKYLSYGFPAGGPCLPRDQKALNHHAYAVGLATKFTHAIDSENNRHSEYLTRFYIQKNPDKNVPFIFSYLSYKSGVDILTESFQLKICIDLLRAGYKVDVPVSVKDMDTPEEFKDYCYNDKVTFGQNPENGYKIN